MEIDDVRLSRGQIISAATYDLASVQVLQGRQALYLCQFKGFAKCTAWPYDWIRPAVSAGETN